MFARCHDKARVMMVVFLSLAFAGIPNSGANLPPDADSYVERINALEGNAWLELGPPSPDPDWGRARGRSWTSKMAYAPTLGGAFLFGEGKHGWYNRRTGRYMDDLWFYDAMAHAWVNLYPGYDTSKPSSIGLNADGFTTIDGDPTPIATMVHGYDMTAWDSDTQRFMSMTCSGGYWKKVIPSKKTLLEQHPRHKDCRKTACASPWFFSVASGKWERKRTNGPTPRSGFGNTLIYIPSRKKTFFRSKREEWLYDAAENRWTRITPSGPRPPFGIDANSCLDPKQDRIYLGGGKYPVAPGGNALWVYDIDADGWSDLQPEGSPGGNSYGTNEAMLHCDLASDVVALIRHKGPDRGVHIYDPVANRWSGKVSDLPAAWSESGRNRAVSGFYHADLNAHFFHVAGDSADNGRFFVYRYKTTNE